MADTQPHMCAAPGCVLPGAIADSTNGSSTWYCACHHGAPYTGMAAITTRLRSRASLFRLALRLSNAEAGQLVPPAVHDWLKARDRVDFLRDDPSQPGPLTCRRLAQRMHAALRRECLSSAAPVTSPVKAVADCSAVLLEGLT